MSAAKIKKGDTVIVLSGKDKGKEGTVTRNLPHDGKLVVAGVKMMTRHNKRNQSNPAGGIERADELKSLQKDALNRPSQAQPTRRASQLGECTNDNVPKEGRSGGRSTHATTREGGGGRR